MIEYTIVIKDRDNSSFILQPDLKYKVKRYSFAAMGGPEEAIIEATGSDMELWRLPEFLRGPVNIYSEQGDAVWWGYISDVQATLKNIHAEDEPMVRIGVSIQDTYNRVAVAYVKVNTTTGAESRDTTSWADHTLSQSEYGIRELLISASAATQAHAEAARDARLSQAQFPVPIIELAPDATESQATITCKGWWSTLGWQYYSTAGTGIVDTATQCKNIITSEGEFIKGVNLDNTSGISIREDRDGDATALFEVVQMMEMGTTNFRRLLSSVDEGRYVRIYEEDSDNELLYYLRSDGAIEDTYGTPARRENPPVGVWAKYKEATPPSFDSALLSDASKIFIEKIAYDVERDRIIPTPRGALDAWDFPVVKDG